MISIIIPAHNVEKTISKCIESIIKQTYTNYEIIIIENGSIDNTKEICFEFVKKYSCVKLLSIDKASPGAARNMGINVARGEYIAFIDGDDTIEKTFLEEMLISIKNVDLVICGYGRINSSKKIECNLLKEGIYDIKTILIEIVKNDTNIYFGAVWNKLYKKDIIIRHNLKFEENMYMAEDLIFNYMYYKNILNVYVSGKCMYNYYVCSNNTLSRKKRDKDSYWNNEKKLYMGLSKLLEEKRMLSSDIKGYLFRYSYYLKRRALNGVFLNYNKEMSNKEKKEIIHSILKDKDISDKGKICNLRKKDLLFFWSAKSRWYQIIILLFNIKCS